MLSTRLNALLGIDYPVLNAPMSGTATADQIGLVFLSCAVLIAIFAPLTMYLYSNKGSR